MKKLITLFTLFFSTMIFATEANSYELESSLRQLNQLDYKSSKMKAVCDEIKDVKAEIISLQTEISKHVDRAMKNIDPVNNRPILVLDSSLESLPVRSYSKAMDVYELLSDILYLKEDFFKKQLVKMNTTIEQFRNDMHNGYLDPLLKEAGAKKIKDIGFYINNHNYEGLIHTSEFILNMANAAIDGYENNLHITECRKKSRRF